MSHHLSVIGTFLLLAGAGASSFWAFNSEGLALESSSSEPAEVFVVQAPTQRPSLTLPSARPEVFYRAITDRPLFVPSRRAQTVAAIAEPVEDERLPEAVEIITRPDDLMLAGVLDGVTNRRAFVIVDGAEGDWLQEGETVAGWTITEIGAHTITLTFGDDTFSVGLFE